MKRSFAFFSRLLSLVLLVCVWQALPAVGKGETLYVNGAEKRTLLQVGPDTCYSAMARWFSAWEEQNPSVPIRSSFDIGSPNTRSLIKALSQKHSQKDVLFLRSDSFDLSELIQANALYDLSGYPSMMQTAALLHPFLQGSFAQQDGLWAFPINLTFYDFLHFDETALALAGYTPADMPASFEEALDFLEQWIQRCQTDPVADVCVTNTLDGPASYTVYLTEQLIKQYTFQCAAQGLQADYTRPVFLEMLDRIAVIGPELSRADSGQGSFCLLTTCSFAKELIHMIPGRLTAQEPMLIPVSVTYLCVNGQSAHPEAAVRFVELYLDLMRNHDYDVAALTEADAEMLMAKALLFRDASDAVVSSDFAWKETYVRDTIAYYEGIAGSSSASETEKEQARVRLQQYDQAHWLENAIKGKYQLTSDELAQFQAMAGELRVCTVDYTVIASKRTRTLVKQFSSGVISAGELARGLNEQVR